MVTYVSCDFSHDFDHTQSSGHTRKCPFTHIHVHEMILVVVVLFANVYCVCQFVLTTELWLVVCISD